MTDEKITLSEAVQKSFNQDKPNFVEICEYAASLQEQFTDLDINSQLPCDPTDGTAILQCWEALAPGYLGQHLSICFKTSGSIILTSTTIPTEPRAPNVNIAQSLYWNERETRLILEIGKWLSQSSPDAVNKLLPEREPLKAPRLTLAG